MKSIDYIAKHNDSDNIKIQLEIQKDERYKTDDIYTLIISSGRKSTRYSNIRLSSDVAKSIEDYIDTLL